MLACGKTLTFGIGDAQVDLRHAGADGLPVHAQGHRAREVLQDGALGEPPGQLLLGRPTACCDVATNNSVGLLFFTPREARAGRQGRGDLDLAAAAGELDRRRARTSIRRSRRRCASSSSPTAPATGPEADKQREVLKGLAYGGFKPADNSYLDPIREMEAVRGACRRPPFRRRGQDRQGPGRVRQDPAPPPPRSAPWSRTSDDRAPPTAIPLAAAALAGPARARPAGLGRGDPAAGDRLQAGGDGPLRRGCSPTPRTCASSARSS